MEKLIKPQEQDPTLESRTRPPRGMLGRIRQASGSFDFSALTGGRKAPEPAAQKDAAPVPYNPLYVPDDNDSITPLSKVWTQPESPAPQAVLSTAVLEWERAKTPPPPAHKSYPSIYESFDDADTRAHIRHRRARGRVPYGRATLNRFLLCLWTLLFGVCIGAGSAPVVERYTDFRVLSNPTKNADVATAGSRSARSGSKPASSKRTGRGRQPAKLRAAARTTAAAAKTVDALAPYRGLLTVPLIAALAISVLWIFGAPEVLGGFATSAYRAAAFAVFALSVWCGMAALMTTLELRVTTAKPALVALSVLPSSAVES